MLSLDTGNSRKEKDDRVHMAAEGFAEVAECGSASNRGSSSHLVQVVLYSESESMREDDLAARSRLVILAIPACTHSKRFGRPLR